MSDSSILKRTISLNTTSIFEIKMRLLCVGGQYSDTLVPRYFTVVLFSTGTVGTLGKCIGTAVAVLIFLNF